MQFDVVRRVGTEMSGIPLDPADVERECENLSDERGSRDRKFRGGN